MRRNPVVYEINTWVWLEELSERYNRRVTLADVPDECITELIGFQLDAIWLMGVWERSPHGQQIATAHTGLQGDYQRALPDWTPNDVAGSPYAVHRYTVDGHLGGREGLALFRSRLSNAGVNLILDYVPNHVAVDHPWVFERPQALIRGLPEELHARPGDFFRSERDERGALVVSDVIAHGRDPYYPAWTDTAQINAFAPEARAVALETLLDLASQCDGVRCDMAMLMVNHIFQRTWGNRGGDMPSTEFWTDIIGGVRAQSPHCLFIAEVYWNMESDLIALGFDYCYDKELYDSLLREPATKVRDHLTAPLDYQNHLVRFIENHDEARASSAFGDARALAAAAMITTLPGMKLFYEGQFDGRERKLPVQLGRRMAEPQKPEQRAVYNEILKITAPYIHDSIFAMVSAVPILGEDAVTRNIFAHLWAKGNDPTDWLLALVNYSDSPVRARALLPIPALATRTWDVQSQLYKANHQRLAGVDLVAHGLSFDLGAYGIEFFTFRPDEREVYSPP